MMGDDEQEVLLLLKLEQHDSQEWPARKVKGSRYLCFNAARRGRLPFVPRQETQIENRRCDHEARRDPLHRLPALRQDGCSQRFVTPQEFMETALQHSDIEQ